MLSVVMMGSGIYEQERKKKDTGGGKKTATVQ